MTSAEPPDWGAIQRAYERGGEGVADLAKRFGVTVNQIRYRARKLGWKAVRRSRRAKTPSGSKGNISMVARLYQTIERKLSMIEARLDSGDDISPADSERAAREIGALIRNLEKLKAFDGQPGRGGKSDIRANGRQGVDDAERWREEIAERIARLHAEWRSSQGSKGT